MALPSFLQKPDPDIYLTDSYIVLDFETDTSHKDYGHPVHDDNKLLLACWKLGPTHPDYRLGSKNAFAKWGGEYEQELLLEHIGKAAFLVAHSSKYELGWLRRCGLDLRTVLPFCSKLAEYVLAGNRAAPDDKQGLAPLSTSLAACCSRRGLLTKDPVTDKLITGGVNPKFIPRPWLLGRCRRDVATTEELFLDQRQALKDSNRLAVAFTRNILTPCLADIEFEGMALAEVDVEKTWAQYRKDLAAAQAEFDILTGGINWNSPKQVGEYIYDTLRFDEPRDFRGNVKRTKKTTRNPEGNRRTDKDTLEWLSSQAKTDEQKAFIAQKQAITKLASALSKSLDFFMGVIKEKGGTFHAVFNQTVTATHRLSSSGIETYFDMFEGTKTAQFQNLARIFKPLFRAKKKGWIMAEADGASIEHRGAGIVCNDPQIRDDILSHHDVHRFTASVLNGVPEEEVTGAMRQDAKSDTFKPLYGGQSGTPEQQAYYAAFKERYAVVAQTQARWVERVLRDKVLVMPWGLRYYWPRAKRSGRSGWVNCTSMVYNYGIQAFATAEVIPIAVTHFWHRIGDLGEQIRLNNTVHDSIIAEIRKDSKELFTDLAITSFTDDVYKYLKEVYAMDVGPTGIPLGVGVKMGPRWGRGEERKFNVFANGEREEYI